MLNKIKSVHAREILSAGDFPTIETTVTLSDGSESQASVPFGTSSGKYEALTLIDNDMQRYDGLGMLTAVNNVNSVIATEIVGMDVTDQKAIDEKLTSLDPTARKEKLGGNSLLSVSLSCARTGALAKSVELHKHIREVYGIDSEILKLPKPMMVVMEGGKHADDSTDFQEYLISVIADVRATETVRMGTEVYHQLGKILEVKGFDVNVGLEGAYAATGVSTNQEPIVYLKQAIEEAGFEFSEEIGVSLDPASSEFFRQGKYYLNKEGKSLNSIEMINYYRQLYEEYDLVSLEDGLDQDDWDNWSELKKTVG